MKNLYTLLKAVTLILVLHWLDANANPTNDNFAARTWLVGTNVTVQGNNTGASSEPGEFIGGGNIYYFYSVWYAWISPTNGVVHFTASTPVYNFFMSVTAYRGAAVNALTAAPTTPDGGVPVTPGDTIAIGVTSIYYPIWSGGGGTGPFTLGLSLEVPAPTSTNDAFAHRLDITTPTYHFDGSIYGATSEPGEPLPTPGANQTLWWRFVPPADCNLYLAASATQFTPTLTVYAGTNFASMSRVNPVSGSIYRLTGSNEYSVQLATGYVPGGSLSLDSRFYSLTNDMFANSTRLEGTNVTFYGCFTGATLEPNEPVPPATNTVWVSWAAPCSGRVSYSVATPPVAQYGTIYTGAALNLLQPVRIVGMGNNTYSFLATEGTVYHFQFSGGGDTFVLSFHEDPFLISTNDNFADALLVRGRFLYISPASVLGATMEIGEPAHMGPVPQKSIWWKWQAPTSGYLSLDANASLVPTVVLALYSGDAVEALRLVGKGTNNLYAPVIAGQTYALAGAVATNAIGDIAMYGQLSSVPSTRIIPGNLLQEPSWEGTGIVDAQYWHWSGSIGGYVNENGGADGTTWPVLSTGATIWQDIPTTPGHQYDIHFAFQVGGNLSSCCGETDVRVSWDTNALGIAVIPEGEDGFWHWADFVATASNATTRVSFQNLARNVEMDAFSVVDMSSRPAIVNQPVSISTVAGGTAAFIVGATGSRPLQYQWYFNATPIPGSTSSLLVLNSVTTNNAGSYFVTLANAFGSVTSAPASLYVDAPIYPTIVWEPYGDTVAPGAYYTFNVAAIGSPPLAYQWYCNSGSIPSATANSLVFTNVDLTNAGVYQVTVHNAAGTVWSLPATLRVTNSLIGGGQVSFANRGFCYSTNLDAPVFDIDGLTPLNGAGFLAQLYAGPALELLRPAGLPVPFRTGFLAGYIAPQTVTLANVPPGSNVVVQVRAWDASQGDTYEEARALGGRFGKSALFSVTAGGDGLPPACLSGLHSFSLQAGLPTFLVGTVQFVEHQPHDITVWALVGQPGYTYLIEKAHQDFVWRPYTILTNITGTATFTDTASGGSAVTFYRARILD